VHVIDSSKIGPVEMLAVSFPGSHFKGEILPQLKDLSDRGLIRVIDLVVLTKFEDGTIQSFEASDLDGDQLAALGPLTGGLDPDGLIGEEDLELAGELLDPGNSAALLVWEDRWAAPISAAIRDAGGVVLAHERIPREAVEEVVSYINGNDQAGAIQ
jgi:uncharacterized membrane protein